MTTKIQQYFVVCLIGLTVSSVHSQEFYLPMMPGSPVPGPGNMPERYVLPLPSGTPHFLPVIPNLGYFRVSGRGFIHESERVFNIGYTDTRAEVSYPYRSMNVFHVRRYSIFPFFGELYCLDCPNANDNAKIWQASAFKLDKEEYPKDFPSKLEGYIFPWAPLILPPPHWNENAGNVYMRDESLYHVFVDEISPLSDDAKEFRVQLTLYQRDGDRVQRTHWYKIGDIVKFSTVGYRVISIVPPQDHEVRGLTGRLIGFVELDKTPISLGSLPHECVILSSE